METKLKPFDLEAAKAGAAVVTRDGRPARIVCFDAKRARYPLVALVEYPAGEFVESFAYDGTWTTNADDKDRLMAPVKRSGWLNLYRRDGLVRASDTGFIYKTEADAFDNRAADYVATIPVEWEE